MSNQNLKRFQSPDCSTLAETFKWLVEQIQGRDVINLLITRKPGKWPNSGDARPYVGVALVNW